MGKLFLYPPGDRSGEELARRLYPRGMAVASDPGNGDWETVVRWRNLIGDDARYPVVLNECRAVRDLESRWPAVLQVNRIPVSSRAAAKSPLSGTYRIFVCNLRPLAAYRATRRSWQRVHRRLPRLSHRAARAAYFLGLDFGAVDATRGGSILNVHPFPDLPSSLVGSFSTALAGLAAELEHRVHSRRLTGAAPRPAVLGADPEFMLLRARTGRMVPASAFFPRYGFVGCDERAVWTPRRRRALAEIRPRPRSDPRELAEAIRGGLRRALRRASRRRVLGIAGNMPFRGFPTGGHIHFSGVRLGSRLMRALDNYLALPLLMVENARTARLRRRRYGFLADWRTKRHGFEYRTPGSWLVSREVALGALCLAKLIGEDFELLRNAPLQEAPLTRAFYRCDKQALRPVIAGLWRDLSLTPTYRLFRPELETLRARMDEAWEASEREDLRRTWGLIPPRRRPSRGRR
ncbi:MAG TPA: hypothetical protein DEQ28_07810 [Clostridiales bacterium]|nr:hypothetical protein [Clostridiales bacterium]